MRCNRCYTKEKKDIKMKLIKLKWVCPVCGYSHY